MFEDEADVNLDELSFDSFILPSVNNTTSTANEPFRNSIAEEEPNVLLFDSPRNSDALQHGSSSVIVDADLLTSPRQINKSAGFGSSVIDEDLLASPLRQILGNCGGKEFFRLSPAKNTGRNSSIVERRCGKEFIKSPPHKNTSTVIGQRCNSPMVDENALMSPPFRNFPAAKPAEWADLPRRSGRGSSGKKIRKFPGPAGIVAVETTQNNEQANQFETSQDLAFSQEPSAAADFAGPAWTRLRADLGSTKNGADLLSTYTVDWIKRHAAADRLVDVKVPFLAAVLFDVEFKLPGSSGSVRLVDPTGTIHATVQHTLHARLADEFVDGAAVLLVRFGVLTVSCAHNLSITSDTLAAIYRPDGSDVRVTNLDNAELSRLLDGSKRACNVPQKSFDNAKKSRLFDEPRLENVASVQNGVKPRTQNVPENVERSGDEAASRPSVQNGLKLFKFTLRRRSPEVCETAPSSGQLSNAERSQILEDVLDGVDTDSFFEDF